MKMMMVCGFFLVWVIFIRVAIHRTRVLYRVLYPIQWYARGRVIRVYRAVPGMYTGTVQYRVQYPGTVVTSVALTPKIYKICKCLPSFTVQNIWWKIQ